MPRRESVSRQAISRILSVGAMFFVMQLMIAIAYSSDNVIIARTMGAASVPGYSIPQRVFSLITLMITMLIMPLWPAYGEAIARGDMTWVRRTLKRSMLGVFGAAVIASSALLLVAHRLIGWWIGPSISPPFILLSGLAAWVVVECCANTLATFLHGANVLRLQAVVLSVFGVACLALKVYSIRRFGIVALPWATVVSYLLIAGTTYAVRVPRSLTHLHAAADRIVIVTPVIED